MTGQYNFPGKFWLGSHYFRGVIINFYTVVKFCRYFRKFRVKFSKWIVQLLDLHMYELKMILKIIWTDVKVKKYYIKAKRFSKTKESEFVVQTKDKFINSVALRSFCKTKRWIKIYCNKKLRLYKSRHFCFLKYYCLCIII